MLFEKDEKEISMEFDIYLQIALPTPPKMYLNSWLDFSNRKSDPYLHCVTLRTGAVCLCYQHPIIHSFIEIDVFLLQNKTKISFTIPISPNNEQQKFNHTTLRVFFSSLGDMLLIYLPGHYVHFVDCSHDGSIIPGTSFTGEILAPFEPFQLTENDFPVLVPYDAYPKGQKPLLLSPDTNGHCFVDITTGTTYEYTFNREMIWKVYDMNFSDKDLSIQLLHIAMIHLRDEELVGKVMHNILLSNSGNSTVAGFRLGDSTNLFFF